MFLLFLCPAGPDYSSAFWAQAMQWKGKIVVESPANLFRFVISFVNPSIRILLFLSIVDCTKLCHWPPCLCRGEDMARGKVKVNLVLATFSLELVFFCTFHHMIFILSKHKFIILSLSFLRLFSLQVSQNYFLAAAGSTLTDKYCSQIILGGFNLITSLLLKTLSSHCVWQPHSKDHSGQLFTMVVVQHHSQPLKFTNIAGDSQKQGIPWTRAPAPVSPNDQSWVCPTVSWPAIDRRPHRPCRPTKLTDSLLAPKSKLGPVRLLPLGTCAPLQVPASHAWRAVSQREEILFSCLRSSGPRLLPPCCAFAADKCVHKSKPVFTSPLHL